MIRPVAPWRDPEVISHELINLVGYGERSVYGPGCITRAARRAHLWRRTLETWSLTVR
jgi:hypothetical protein